jgi:hypothetical protein
MKSLAKSELSAPNKHLSSEETREIVTPYAFQVSDDLLGTPLATPTKRGFALLIDLGLVAMLTQVSSVLLAGIAAWTFFKAGNRLKQKKRFNGFRIFLRLLTAFLLFVVAIGVFDEINNEFGQGDNKDTFLSSEEKLSTAQGINMVALTAKYLLFTKDLVKNVENGECEVAMTCWQELGGELSRDVAKTPLDEKEIQEVFDGFVQQSEDSLSENEQQQLLELMQQQYELAHAAEPLGQGLQSSEYATTADVIKELQAPAEFNDALVDLQKEDNKEESFSLIAWVKGIAADMGLGFGWAAFYFSLFTAWWHGQTPGKRLFKIKVIQLDGSGLNLWQSFERYGGYGAGLATGLLGFLQIYWDPNRQAIHDKISATLVIDMAKPKVEFVKGSA